MSGIVEETKRVLEGYQQERYMTAPSKDMIIRCEHEFSGKWNFPNCFGCVDGQQIRIRNSAHAGSMYHNYKQFFLIVW